MKKILLPVALIFAILGASSCEKCIKCENKSDERDQFQICAKDYNGSLDEATDLYEGQGYECKDKLRSK